jgi:hypothetical protein
MIRAWPPIENSGKTQGSGSNPIVHHYPTSNMPQTMRRVT